MKLNYKDARKFLEFDKSFYDRKIKTIYGDGIDLVYKLTELKKLMSKYVGEHDMKWEYKDNLMYLYDYPKDGMEEEDAIRVAQLGFVLDELWIAMRT